MIAAAGHLAQLKVVFIALFQINSYQLLEQRTGRAAPAAD
jgi:hypothetical protein